MSSNTNLMGVKISEFNVANTISDSSLIPFVSSGSNLTISFANLKNELGVTGAIKSSASASAVSILDQASGQLNYIRGVLGSQGITTTLSPVGDIQIKTNLANGTGTGAEGLIIDPTAAQVKFKAIAGGTNTTVSTSGETVVIDVEDSDPLTKQKIVRSAADFDSPLDPTIQYFVDGVIDLGATQLNVGASGCNINGLGFGISGLTSTEASYTMFSSLSSGNVFISNVEIIASGASSQVFDLTDSDGTHAVELSTVNFNGCTSLGTLDGFRQMLEINTGRFGGSPNLTLDGSMNGVRIDASIVRGITNGTDLFTAGGSLTMSGRFVTNFNVDMPATGALFDFSAANFNNDESLVINGALVTRAGVADSNDSTLHPNIDNTSVKSNWGDNVGLPNTNKFIKASCTVEAATALSGQPVSTYLPVAGTYTVSDSVQFDSPANGEYRLLTGNGIYKAIGTIYVKGTAGDQIDLRIMKSTDGGATFPTEINHIGLEILNLTGSADQAVFSINFIEDLKKNDRIRIEAENNTAARDITVGLESFITVSEV